MWGPDVSLGLGDKLELNVQYARRVDDKADYGLAETETQGMFGELIYTPQGDESKLYGVALYNWVDSDIASLNCNAGTIGLGYMLRRNIRLIGEYTHDFDKEYGQAAVGIVTAF